MINNETLIITVGKRTQDIVDLIYKDNSDINFVNLDYEKQVINTSEIKTIWYNNLKFQKDKYDFEEYKNVLLNRTSKFNEIIKSYKNLVIVSYIGDEISFEMLFEVIKYIKNFEIMHKLFVVKPSVFERKIDYNLVVETLEKIHNLKYTLGEDLFVFNSNEYFKEKPKSINHAKSAIDKKASEILSMILELNNKPAFVMVK